MKQHLLVSRKLKTVEIRNGYKQGTSQANHYNSNPDRINKQLLLVMMLLLLLLLLFYTQQYKESLIILLLHTCCCIYYYIISLQFITFFLGQGIKTNMVASPSSYLFKLQLWISNASNFTFCQYQNCKCPSLRHCELRMIQVLMTA